MSDDVQVLIDNVDRTDRLINSTLRWTEYEGGQTGAMSLEIEDVDDDLSISEWQQVVVKIGPTLVWGGYIIRSQPGLTEGGNRRWSLQCESWDTLLNRTPIVRCTYANKTPAEIIADLFARAELTNEFDAEGLVAANLPVIGSFVAAGEKLTDLLDRLALLAGASWWISLDREVVFTLPASLPTAPFAVKALGLADFSTSFPPSGSPTPDIDAADIRNRVTVYGGVVPSAIEVALFYGDGATKRFTLDHAPVHEIVKITVDGVLQWHGYDFYDSQFNNYDCLVDYTLGTVRWLDAPANGAEIEIQYRYKQQLVTVRQSDASYERYMRWFDFELRDGSLTTEPACIAAADALLAEYAFPAVGASLEVEWFGPRAGQRVQVEMPSLGLSGFYVVRQATVELARSTRRVLVSLKVGGRAARLSRVIGGERGTGSMIGPGAYLPAQPNQSLSGEIDLLRVRDRIELLDRSTTFVSPSNYGNATGLVLLFDAVAQQGRLLGLDGGVAQAYFDHDGRIRWDGGNAMLAAGGLYIGGDGFNDPGVQFEYNGGTPRAYIGNGDNSYFLFDGADAQFGGLIYAMGGHFSGSVYVGTATPRIHIDGANKRIESTNFASGTAGFRIEGATGNAEFNNITARGAIASAVFTYNQVQATAGEIVVAKGAGKLRSDFAVTGGSGNILIEDPPGISHAAAGGLWSVNDIIRMKDPGVGDSWFKVLSVVDQTTHWSLLAQYQAGNTLVTFKAATAVVNYGQSGQGIVRISAAGSYTPYVSLATHAGLPWASLTEKARLGNLDGVSGASGYGLWTDNGFFTGVLQATTGLIGGWTIEADKLSAEGVGMEPAAYPFYAGSNKPSDAPFRVTPSGQLTASDAVITGDITATSGTFTGTVYATSGEVAGWKLTPTRLYSEDVPNSQGVGMATYQDAEQWAFWAGANVPGNAEFRVTKYGQLYATGATIAGAVTASSGSITGQLTMGASGKITGGSAWELNQGGLRIADTVDTALLFGGGTSYMKLWTSGSYGGAIDGGTYPLALNTGRDLSLNANAGNVFGGSVRLKNNGNTQVQVGNNTLGFFGVTPVNRPAAYTFTNGATDRAINCTSTTLGEVANVLFTMWTDLKNLGLLQ